MSISKGLSQEINSRKRNTAKVDVSHKSFNKPIIV